MKDKIVILIPSRFASSRFPGKPLHPIAGVSLIQRVYENCVQSGFDVFVVTDDQRIEDHVYAFQGRVLRVDDDVPSGSERIHLAYERHLKIQNYKLIINVQGDEPLLKGEEIKALAEFHLTSPFDITTMLKRRHSSEADFTNPNVVKAVWENQTGKCHYFSRSSVPHGRDGVEHDWFQHIGIYSYRPEALTKFAKAPATALEKLEKLEQLRALGQGLSLGAIETKHTLLGVDTPEDVLKVEGVLNGQS